AQVTTRQASSTAFRAAGNLQLQGVISGGALRAKPTVGSPDDPVQQHPARGDAASDVPSNRARPSLDRNARRPAGARGRDSSNSGSGFNLARAHTAHTSTHVQAKCAACETEEADGGREPVQAKCAACEAGGASGEQGPVQLWDCGEFTEP